MDFCQKGGMMMISSNYELGIVIKNIEKDNPKIAIIQVGNLNTDAFKEKGETQF